MLEWQRNASNTINFQLVDVSNNAVIGLGSAFMCELAVPGTSVFSDGVGVKSELGSGWYRYASPPTEAASPGEIAISASGAGTTQQNLVYQIGNPQTGYGAVETTINVVVDGVPQDQAAVWITSDEAGAYLVAGTAYTNAQGNVNFWLDAGGYYVWIQKSPHRFSNPTSISVSS
jgi:hypothetical protein